HLQGFAQQRRAVDVSVAVNLPVTQELRILEAGDEPKNVRLLTVLEVVLEADQVVGVRAQVLLAQLHHSVRYVPGARIAQADRLHRSEAQRVAPSPGNFLDGQAAFKVV